MTKRNPGAHEVPEPTAEPLTGQTSFFDDAPAAALPFDAIREMLLDAEQIRNDPNYIANDLVLKLDEIKILNQRGSNPDAIATACRSAADDARKLYDRSGNNAFLTAAQELESIAENVCPFLLQRTDPSGGQSIVYTPTGKEFVLPDELEAYRADNPAGAAMYEEEQAAAQEVQKITFEVPDIDPELDPNSPEFDIEKWKAAMDAMDGTIQERMERAMQHITQTLFKSIEGNAESTRIIGESMVESMAGLAQMAQNAVAGITAFINSDIYAAITDSFRKLNEFVEEHRDEIEAAADAAEELRPLIPFLQQELEEMKTDPQFTDCTITDLLKGGFDEDGNPTESPWRQAIERAKARKEEYDKAEELAAAAEQMAENLPLLQSIVPKSHTMPNNALMNALQQKPAINAGEFDLIVANEKGRRKEITAYTMVSYDPGETGITITDAKLSEYERQVSDAVISLWQEAQKQNLPTIFTTDMIYRAMPGGGDKASPQQKGAITKTIEKFRRLHITVDATEEMRKRGIKGKDGKPVAMCRFDNFYLSATHAEYKVKAGGQSVSAYRIDSEPIILTYSKMTSQLLTVDAKFIEVKKVKKGKLDAELVTMNRGRQAMTGYMLRRIAVMKRDKKNKVQIQSNIILFDTLFREAGTATADRKQTGLNRNFCFEVLDYWKATGFIRDYHQQTKGRSITGIEICL